jgi:hypothetical protein
VSNYDFAFITGWLLTESFLELLLLLQNVVHVDLEIVHHIVEIFIVVLELPVNSYVDT